MCWQQASPVSAPSSVCFGMTRRVIIGLGQMPSCSVMYRVTLPPDSRNKHFNGLDPTTIVLRMTTKPARSTISGEGCQWPSVARSGFLEWHNPVACGRCFDLERQVPTFRIQVTHSETNAFLLQGSLAGSPCALVWFTYHLFQLDFKHTHTHNT